MARAWLLSGGMSVLLEMFLQDPLSIAGTGIITARITQELNKKKAKRDAKREEDRNLG